MKTAIKILSLLAVITTSASGQGTILWNESVNGPLSNDGGNPTPLGGLQSGSNTLSGASEQIPFQSGWFVTNDFFTFTVPSGLQVASLQLGSDQPILIWLGDTTFSTELRSIFNPLNGNLLPQLGLTSITSGSYGMYVSNQDFQSAPTIANYRLDFFVQSIPEPNTLSLLLVGIGLIGFLGWRRRQLKTN